MNPIEIVRSLEGLIFEVATWFILVPKTVAKIVTSPAWISNYVTEEFLKPREERFNEFASPIVVWILLAVFPYLWGTKLLNLSLTGEVKEQVLITALFLAAGPIGFATGLVAAKKDIVSKSTLERSFYVQCYCFTPVYLFLLPAALLIAGNWTETMEPLAGMRDHPFIFWISAGLGTLFLFISEIIAIRHHLKATLIRSAIIFFPILFASYMVWWVIVFLLAVGMLTLQELGNL